jgi:uncharacterized protein
MMFTSIEPLSDAQLDWLDDYLLSDSVSESFDYIALHGFMCALAVSPKTVPEQQWLAQVLEPACHTDNGFYHKALNLIRQDYAYICQCLELGHGIEMPCDLTLEQDTNGDNWLQDWACGFMSLFFEQEQDWFAEHELLIAECLLPFMLAANLDQDQELADLRQKDSLCQQLCEQIPELLQDLFLLFRVPGVQDQPTNNKRQEQAIHAHYRRRRKPELRH